MKQYEDFLTQSKKYALFKHAKNIYYINENWIIAIHSYSNDCFQIKQNFLIEVYNWN